MADDHDLLFTNLDLHRDSVVSLQIHRNRNNRHIQKFSDRLLYGTGPNFRRLTTEHRRLLQHILLLARTVQIALDSVMSTGDSPSDVDVLLLNSQRKSLQEFKYKLKLLNNYNKHVLFRKTFEGFINNAVTNITFLPRPNHKCRAST